MNLQTIAEHTVDLDLIDNDHPKSVRILDAGCRGFEFTNYFRTIGYTVFAIDADNFSGVYDRIALSDYDGLAGIIKSNDPSATRIFKDQMAFEVQVMTIKSFSDMVDVGIWDIIKLDIEGSEYEVIMSMDRTYATQITVEFHLHCGQTEKQVQECVDKLHALGYKTIQHEKTARHGLKPNFWDSCFALENHY